MLSEVQRQIAQAARGGIDLKSIDETLIDPAPVDEEQKAALWLYAQALRDRPIGASSGARSGREGALLR